MRQRYIITGAMFGLLAVIFGAFGAHGLKKVLDSATITSFETGVRYQMYHALLLVILGNSKKYSSSILYWCFTIGVCLFSGSIYLLCLDELIGVNLSGIALTTPVGGAILIIGWTLLVVRGIKNASPEELK
ncbi:DUF423 domain-containing protein [Zunongwangia sp.]|uniref:DUF423 domain-containing protein n=1 Tax=Zunongwangia sp. TaxID=1965325 RepID=UPI003AA84221